MSPHLRCSRTTGECGHDSGMSSVELIIAMMISALVLGIIATIFGQGLGAQQQAAERNAATARATAQTTIITENSRDAVAAWYSGNRDEVRLKVLNNAGTVTCHAWRVETTNPVPTTSVLSHRTWQPPAAMPTEWTVLDQNAQLTASAPVATGSPLSYNARSSTVPSFTLTIFANNERSTSEAATSRFVLRPLKLAADTGGACW